MTNKQKTDDYKNVIDSIYRIMKGDKEVVFPKINDSQTQLEIDFICKRLENPEIYCDNVYAYYFKDFNSVYIGRTIHLTLRDKQHRMVKNNSPVLRFALEHNTNIPDMTVLCKYLTLKEGVDKENYYCQKLKNEGWNLINTAPTGNYLSSIGSFGKEKWNYEKCFEEALKYENVKDFREYSKDAYKASLRHGFIKDFNWLNGRRLNTTKIMSYEECKNIALKYKTLKDFMKYERKVYRFAQNRNWVKDFSWLKREKEHAKSVEQYTCDGVLLNQFVSINKASEITNIPYSQIYNCCNEKRKDAGGFLWKYK